MHHRLHETGSDRMLRLSKEIKNRPLFNDTARLHHRHLVTDFLDHRHLMGDQYDGDAIPTINLLQKQ